MFKQNDAVKLNETGKSIYPAQESEGIVLSVGNPAFGRRYQVDDDRLVVKFETPAQDGNVITNIIEGDPELFERVEADAL